VIDFCGNDTDLPNLIWRERDYWTLRRLFLWDLVVRAFGGDADPWRERAFDHAPVVDARGRFAHDPEQVPPAYRHLVGWDNWRRAMERLVALGREHGFVVVVTTHWECDARLPKACAELGLPLFSGHAPVSRYLQEHGITDYRRSALTRNPQDPHPTALHHRLQFESLWGIVEQQGLLPWLTGERR
jgi:hypothetical protein